MRLSTTKKKDAPRLSCGFRRRERSQVLPAKRTDKGGPGRARSRRSACQYFQGTRCSASAIMQKSGAAGGSSWNGPARMHHMVPGLGRASWANALFWHLPPSLIPSHSLGALGYERAGGPPLDSNVRTVCVRRHLRRGGPASGGRAGGSLALLRPRLVYAPRSCGEMRARGRRRRHSPRHAPDMTGKHEVFLMRA